MGSNGHTMVYCQLMIDGIHRWDNAPDEVFYLRHPHRHTFYIKCGFVVSHNDRDIEFIMKKHEIEDTLRVNYYKMNIRMCDFGHMSCEHIAHMLMNEFNDMTYCSVYEDGENGAEIDLTAK